MKRILSDIPVIEDGDILTVGGGIWCRECGAAIERGERAEEQRHSHSHAAELRRQFGLTHQQLDCLGIERRAVAALRQQRQSQQFSDQDATNPVFRAIVRMGEPGVPLRASGQALIGGGER